MHTGWCDVAASHSTDWQGGGGGGAGHPWIACPCTLTHKDQRDPWPLPEQWMLIRWEPHQCEATCVLHNLLYQQLFGTKTVSGKATDNCWGTTHLQDSPCTLTHKDQRDPWPLPEQWMLIRWEPHQCEATCVLHNLLYQQLFGTKTVSGKATDNCWGTTHLQDSPCTLTHKDQRDPWPLPEQWMLIRWEPHQCEATCVLHNLLYQQLFGTKTVSGKATDNCWGTTHLQDSPSSYESPAPPASSDHCLSLPVAIHICFLLLLFLCVCWGGLCSLLQNL